MVQLHSKNRKVLYTIYLFVNIGRILDCKREQLFHIVGTSCFAVIPNKFEERVLI